MTLFWGPNAQSRCILIGLALIGILGGAASTAAQQVQQWETILKEYMARSAACVEEYQRGTLASATMMTHCADDGLYGAMAKADYPYIDLIQLMIAERLAIADRLDSSRISAAEANAQLAELISRIVGESNRRDLASDAAAAQTRAANDLQETTTRLEAEARVRAQAADVERRRCFFSALGQPTRTGRFGEAMANAQAICSGRSIPQSPPVTTSPQNTLPSTTTCHMFGTIVHCNTR
jgi:hypothetical protein